MTTEADIADLLFRIARENFTDAAVYQWGAIPKGQVKATRITVQAKPLHEGKIWRTGAAEVNICIPFLSEDGTADLTRLKQAERQVTETFDGKVISLTDHITLDVDTRNRIKDDTLKCHIINAHLRVSVLNTINTKTNG